jgi:ribosomal protein L16 Arg81 hydroxylase
MGPFSAASATLLEEVDRTSSGADPRSSMLFGVKDVLLAITETINRYQITVPQVRVIGGLPKPAGEYFRWKQGRDRRMQSELPADTLRTLLADLLCSVVINRWDRYDPAIWEACNQLAARFDCDVVGNLYVSGERSRSFGRHWDDHDVIVLHVAGTKMWHLFDEKVVPAVAGASFSTPTGPPMTSICLRPGDALFIPAGQWHDVETTAETISVHISIGLFPFTVADWLREQIASLETTEPWLTEPAPRSGPPSETIEQLSSAILGLGCDEGIPTRSPTP